MLPRQNDRVNVYYWLLQGIAYLIGGIFLVYVRESVKESGRLFFALNGIAVSFLVAAFLLITAPICRRIEELAHKIEDIFVFGLFLVSIVAVLKTGLETNQSRTVLNVTIGFLIYLFVVFFWYHFREMRLFYQQRGARVARILIPISISIVLSLFALAQYLLGVRTMFDPFICLAIAVVTLSIAVFYIFRTKNSLKVKPKGGQK